MQESISSNLIICKGSPTLDNRKLDGRGLERELTSIIVLTCKLTCKKVLQCCSLNIKSSFRELAGKAPWYVELSKFSHKTGINNAFFNFISEDSSNT